MDKFILANAKMWAGAFVVAVTLLLKPYLPQLVDPSLQEALVTLIQIGLTAAAVWITPNKKLEDSSN